MDLLNDYNFYKDLKNDTWKGRDYYYVRNMIDKGEIGRIISRNRDLDLITLVDEEGDVYLANSSTYNDDHDGNYLIVYNQFPVKKKIFNIIRLSRT